MGNTSIQTQSYRAVDKDAGQAKQKLHYSIRAAVLTVFSLGGSQ